ncbi:MAG: restriction endonuclease [Chlorobiaceae bacterium]|nr:restriction endonuclease [Chlorobiaceae bacterium]
MGNCATTCKDRWRQVLAEARRIEQKHLLTIEASISSNQTDEMAAWNVQLVLPRSIHETYTSQQQRWLMSISEFTSLVLQKQNKA